MMLKRFTITFSGLLMTIASQLMAGQLYPSERLSSGLMTCLCQDSNGYIWIGTDYGLNKFDGYHFTHYLHRPGDSTSIANNEIASLHVDSDGTLWVGCSRGLSRYDARSDCFHNYRFPDDRHPRVNSLLSDDQHRLFIGTAGYGIYTLEHGSQDIHYETEMNRRNIDRFYSRMFFDREQALWRSSHVDTLTRITGYPSSLSFQDFVSPYGQPMAYLDYSDDAMLVVFQKGMMRYNYNSRQLTDTGYDFSVLGGQPDIVSAITDREGNIYVGTTVNGLLVIRRGEQRLEHLTVPNYGTADVSCVMEDRNQNLWVACYKRGLLLLGKDRDAFSAWTIDDQHLQLNGSTSSIVSGGDGNIFCSVYPGGICRFDSLGHITGMLKAPDGVRTMHRDGLGRYWLGTESTLYRYDPQTGQATFVETIAGRGLTCMADDGEGTLYVGVFGSGLYILNTLTGESELLSMSDMDRPGGYLCNNWIKSLFLDSKGMLWICTTDGTSMLKPQGRIFNSQHWNQLLQGKQCYSACEMSDGNILIGTETGLYCYDRQKNEVNLLPQADQLHDKMICAMVRDSQGTIWMSTNMGIWQMTEKPERHIIAHINGNGLHAKEYVLGASLYTQGNGDGDRIFFGTANGITTFRPVDVMADKTPLGDVHLTRLLVNGHSAALDGKNTYYFSYKENSLQMEFSLMDYRNPENISFQWRTSDSREWHSLPEGDNQLVLNELQPGRYQIEVRASNNGLFSNDVYKLDISIAQPWYRSMWAYLLYILIIGTIIGLLLYTYLRQQRRNLEETKMRFLINATHDIRSPLTLIMGAVKKLRAPAGEEKNEEAIDTIDRNAQRLLLLVNQILDERKIDKGQLQLHCAKTEMTSFVGSIVKLYEFGAAQRNISLCFEQPDQKLYAWIDRTQFDKVVSNLLSNAMKYTPDGGEIKVTLSAVQRAALSIVVQDSGLGFSDDNTDKFFERFYQGKNSRDLHIDGTGIGLNLSRAITEMHGGRVEASNRKDGHTGAILSIIIPTGHSHLKPEQLVVEEPVKLQKKATAPNSRVLVVDDDPEIVRYVISELQPWYRFDTASNGREALKLLLTNAQDTHQRTMTQGYYDLVISDVIMPEMDGLTLLKCIKQNPQISHIPVILLTSKAEVEYRLEGLRKGADGYLAKPFQMEELHVLIDNLLGSMRRMRGKFSGALQQQERVEKVEVKGNNDILMDRVMKVINAHLSDPDLTVEVLTEEIGISRAQLHRKMKEITGVSVTEFLRNLRMEQAARLIREKKINISQVAFSVGFSNQTHFSTTFKRHFGMTPTEYADRS